MPHGLDRDSGSLARQEVADTLPSRILQKVGIGNAQSDLFCFPHIYTYIQKAHDDTKSSRASFCGAVGDRTPVQTLKSCAFYMLIRPSGFRVWLGGRHPTPHLSSLKSRPWRGAPRRPSLIFLRLRIRPPQGVGIWETSRPFHYEKDEAYLLCFD